MPKGKLAVSMSYFGPPSMFKPTAGWSTAHLLLLAAVAAASGYAGSAFFSKESRDYSRPDKFLVPKYGNVKDMEAVSPPVMCLLVNMSNAHS